MSNIKETLHSLHDMDGFLGAGLVDYSSGMCLGSVATPNLGFDIEMAAAGNAAVVKAKKNIRDLLKVKDRIEDILISLDTQYHLIRMLKGKPNFFLYLVLDRKTTNLGMAKANLKTIEVELLNIT